MLPILTGIELDSEQGERVSDERGKVFREKFLPTLKPFPSVRELFVFLNNNRIEFAIATSASEEDLSALLKKCEIDDLVGSKSASSDDADKSKPDPDIINAALKKLKVRPNATVMVGDTPYDIEAARRANLNTFAFRCGGFWKDNDLKNAIRIMDGPADFLEFLKTIISRP